MSQPGSRRGNWDDVTCDGNIKFDMLVKNIKFDMLVKNMKVVVLPSGVHYGPGCCMSHRDWMTADFVIGEDGYVLKNRYSRQGVTNLGWLDAVLYGMYSEEELVTILRGGVVNQPGCKAPCGYHVVESGKLVWVNPGADEEGEMRW